MSLTDQVWTDGRSRARLIDVAGLQALIETLAADGFTVLGPTVRSGAIVTRPVAGVDDLPRGWGDEQAPGTTGSGPRRRRALRVRRRRTSWKTVLFPSHELLWSGEQTTDGFTVDEPAGSRLGDAAVRPARGPLVRRARARDPRHGPAGRVAQDAGTRRGVLAPSSSPSSAPTRAGPASASRWAPVPRRGGRGLRPGADRAARREEHVFVVEAGSERGADVLDGWPPTRRRPTTGRRADHVVERAAGGWAARSTPRHRDPALRRTPSTPAGTTSRAAACRAATARWSARPASAPRVEDHTDLSGDAAERWRVWDSCFTRTSPTCTAGPSGSLASRYRQWMTHKLGSWIDQFGMSGCVGCGRCITLVPGRRSTSPRRSPRSGPPRCHRRREG